MNTLTKLNKLENWNSRDKLEKRHDNHLGTINPHSHWTTPISSSCFLSCFVFLKTCEFFFFFKLIYRRCSSGGEFESWFSL